jgi:hypothetical protein
MPIRVEESGRRAGFVQPRSELDRPIKTDDPDEPTNGWARLGPGGRAHRAEIPAQAQVAAWARHPLRPRAVFGELG